MFRDADSISFANEQGNRARKLFSAVVLAVLDDAIKDEKKHGTGASGIASWARSRDGRTVLSCAGIDPTERAIEGLVAYVRRGVRTSASMAEAA